MHLRELIKNALLTVRDRKEKEKAQLPAGIKLGTSWSVVCYATTRATTTSPRTRQLTKHPRAVTRISGPDWPGDGVEDVDQDQEDGDEEGHPARNDFRGDEEADPGDDDEHSGWKVVGDDVVRDLALERQFESRDRVVPCKVKWSLVS